MPGNINVVKAREQLEQEKLRLDRNGYGLAYFSLMVSADAKELDRREYEMTIQPMLVLIIGDPLVNGFIKEALKGNVALLKNCSSLVIKTIAEAVADFTNDYFLKGRERKLTVLREILSIPEYKMDLSILLTTSSQATVQELIERLMTCKDETEYAAALSGLMREKGLEPVAESLRTVGVTTAPRRESGAGAGAPDSDRASPVSHIRRPGQ